LRPDDLTWAGTASPFAGDGGVQVRWLGTAGFALTAGAHTLLVDPYLTRASLGRCVIAPLRPDAALVPVHTPRADAIVVGHTHFDHALDVPAIAAHTGALVFGSRSAAHLCRAAGLPAAQVRDVEPAPGAPPPEAEVGPFRLRFLPSAHSPLLLGSVPFPGDIADCDQVPLRAERYRCGAVFAVEIRVAGRTIVHLGSAELVERTLDVKNVDLALVCVAGWTTSERYPERLMAALAPGAILLSHWDNFLRPLAEPARILPAMRLPQLVDRLRAADTRLPIGTLPINGAVTL
jgi:L-ascorbate metabolism protein UlaG (beta-lactamase superfamily)